jgi:DUF1680 family protein
MTGFTCCNGTALESNTKLQDTIYFHSAITKALYVNLFIPVDAEVGGAQGHRSAGDELSVRRHDEAHY